MSTTSQRAPAARRAFAVDNGGASEVKGFLRSGIAVAIGIMWLAAAATAVLAPDLVTGSAQEHIPLAGVTIWFYVACSTGFILTSRPRGEGISGSSVTMLCAVWVGVTLASIFGPEMVTGTDPTRIPLAVLVAPIAGLIGTAFIAIGEARQHSERQR